jgi:hypothetical protein
MKIGKLILGASLATCSTFADSWNTYGNTTYGSDGSSYTKYGNTTYGSDGSSYTNYGNSVYGR